MAARTTLLRSLPGGPRASDPAALLAGIRARDPVALAQLHDRFAGSVLRILRRILGPDHELEDLHHDVFVRALRSIGDLREPEALPGWLHAIAAHTAHGAIERRTRRRRWGLFSVEAVQGQPEPLHPGADLDAREALRVAYRMLDQLPTDERVAFTLRYFDGMELTEVAQVSRVSLATIKRRLGRAEQQFRVLAGQSPVLAEYLEGGARWTRG